ncbi:ComEC/Rec2 family competence protein [Caballeronia sp. LZ019]|uniref:ComEC/Rec2 family competence protein n=1 Tax=Caballeronia sp. LZ019 TaxID=3038555 RepID=UPI002865189D|nr:ComEC/Rec2 family competence protein [Caballeronia sp. LZ019]MDR5809441.1 ComEC/Rec2 family competence protein [Caballeronia sp. LZ019]
MKEERVRAMLLGFALGVGWLQQQARLPGLLLCCVAVCIALSAGGIARRRFGSSAFVIAAVVAGFAYAALRAEIRLRPHLPVDYEQRDIELTGFVRGLPEPQPQGTRFLFEVEANGAGLHDFPKIVRLLWVPAATHAPPPSHAGQRWTLTARLKRPHANANFSLRDGEVALLERGIRATGSVSLARAPR